MPYFLLYVDYPSATGTAQKLALLAQHHGSMTAVYLITYVFFGIALAVFSLALQRRMRDAAPAIMEVATVVGFIWALVLVASGLVFNFGMETVAGLYPSQPEQALAVWQAIEPVANGLGGAGEILGGVWVLLVSWTALRTGALPKALGWLGMAVGLLGIISVVPALRDAVMGFAMLQIVWLVWIGVVLLGQPRLRANRSRRSPRSLKFRSSVSGWRIKRRAAKDRLGSLSSPGRPCAEGTPRARSHPGRNAP